MGASPRLSVLVVDDDPVVRDVLVVRLRGWGHEALSAADVPSAVRRVREEHPDVIVSDVVMPGASGVDLIAELDGDEDGPPVVLITAHALLPGELSVAESATEAVALLTKPLDMDELRSILEGVAGS